MSPRVLVCCAIAVTALLLVVAPAGAAQQLTEMQTPSEHVDGDLRAKVLLPDGYDGRRRFPVLFLLHGAGDDYTAWSLPGKGQIERSAAGVPAIVVMPEARRGFYVDGWNGGKRDGPGWGRFFTEELIEQVEDRFRIAPGRANHAIAGLSMGGHGALLIAAQRPDYFGTAASFSGAISHQRPEFELGLPLVATGTSYEAIFGPRDGFYATGNNARGLAANLRNTRLYVTTGDGAPAPAHAGESDALAGLVETEIRLQNDDFAAAARAAGTPLTYEPLAGQHQWPYWREAFARLQGFGMFAPADAAPAEWTYTTARQRGRAWNLEYEFDRPLTALATVSLARGRVSVSGAGVAKVTLRNAGGCGIATLDLPVRDVAPPAACPARDGRAIELTARPRVVLRGVATTIRFRAFARTAPGHREPVARALVRFAGRARRTDGDGIVRFRVRLVGRPGPRTVTATKRGFDRAIVTVTLR